MEQGNSSKNLFKLPEGNTFFCRSGKAILPFLLFLLFSSNAWSGAFQSTIAIDSVSVLENNHVIIGWTLVTNAQEGFVEIHRRLDSGLYAPINQVPLHQTYYIDAGVNAASKPYSYYVVARYPNGDNIAVGNEAHQTVFIKEIQRDICSKLLIPAWSNYEVSTTAGQILPLPVPFDRNLLYVSFEGGEFEQILELDFDPEETFFPVEEQGTYCIKVKTLQTQTGINSSSNVRCIEFNYPDQPGFLHIRQVTATDFPGEVKISFYGDDAAPNPSYIIYREGNDEIFYPQDIITPSQSDFAWYDSNARADIRSENYIVKTLDSCNVQVLTPIYISTVFLEVQSVSPDVNQLSWNQYNGWPETGVHGYIVKRKIEGYTEFEELSFLPPGSFSYTDDLGFFDQEILYQPVYYRIIAIEGEGNPMGFQDTVFSNQAHVIRETSVFVPNAFKPGSQIADNRVFKPVFSFFSPSDYSMVVFDRWGQQVFQSSDPFQAWDGRSSSGDSPAGVYSWVIRYRDQAGRENEKKGAVILIR